MTTSKTLNEIRERDLEFSLTHRTGETPENWTSNGHGDKHLDYGPTGRMLHSLTVLRETVHLNHEEAF